MIRDRASRRREEWPDGDRADDNAKQPVAVRGARENGREKRRVPLAVIVPLLIRSVNWTKAKFARV